LEKCFTQEFQDEAELHRGELAGNLVGPIAVIEDTEIVSSSEEADSGDDSDSLNINEVADSNENSSDEEDDIDDVNGTVSDEFAIDSVGDLSGEEQRDVIEVENPHIGRQVAVVFDRKPYPGIISGFNVVTRKYAVDFDDEDDHSDVSYSELVFMD
jgi:hypothetical protein